MSTPRYPDHQMMFGHGNSPSHDDQDDTTSWDETSDEDPAYARFADLREAILLDYGYNTARAYWGDLESFWWWAKERGKDIFALTDQDARQYKALLRRRQYSENTIRRQMVVWGKWKKAVETGRTGDRAGRRGSHQL
jgi:hypothetical protein